MNNSTTSDSYVPGVCNINRAEIAQRRKAGYLGLAIFVVALAAMLLLGVNRWVRLLLILPAILAAIGFLQAKNHFCVGYGAAGLQNANEGSDSASEVAVEAAAKDRAKAKRMNRQATAIGILAGAVAVLLPNIG